MSPRRTSGVAAWLLCACAAWLGLAGAQPVGGTVVPSPADKAQPAEPAPPEVATALAAPRLRGWGRLGFMGLRVYEARLWQPSAQPVLAADWVARPLALDIRYQRGLSGAQIAERSLKEMRRQGELDDATANRWLAAMKALFPDVVDGTRITGLNLPGQGVRFFVDGKDAGAVDDPAFARRFFGIWLAPQTSEPALRTALLGPGG